MNLLISMQSNMAIYEQIKTQIKALILSKELKETEQLPSIRKLATKLQVGIITVKRAYDDLVNEGLIVSQMGKGFFVKKMDLAEIQNEYIKEVTKRLGDLKPLLIDSGLNSEQLCHIIKKTLEDL